ncbi:hypothetical protein FPOAC2_01337 [Fusarium poae]
MRQAQHNVAHDSPDRQACLQGGQVLVDPCFYAVAVQPFFFPQLPFAKFEAFSGLQASPLGGHSSGLFNSPSIRSITGDCTALGVLPTGPPLHLTQCSNSPALICIPSHHNTPDSPSPHLLPSEATTTTATTTISAQLHPSVLPTSTLSLSSSSKKLTCSTTILASRSSTRVMEFFL